MNKNIKHLIWGLVFAILVKVTEHNFLDLTYDPSHPLHIGFKNLKYFKQALVMWFHM